MALAAVDTLSDDGLAEPLPTPTAGGKDESPSKGGGRGQAKSKAKSKPKAKPNPNVDPESESSKPTPKPKPKAKSAEKEKAKKAEGKKTQCLKRPAAASSTEEKPPMKRPASSEEKPEKICTSKGMYKNGTWGIKLFQKEVIRVTWYKSVCVCLQWSFLPMCFSCAVTWYQTNETTKTTSSGKAPSLCHCRRLGHHCSFLDRVAVSNSLFEGLTLTQEFK